MVKVMEKNLTKHEYSVEIEELKDENVKELIYKLDTYDNELVEGIENVKIMTGDNKLIQYLNENDINHEATSDNNTKVQYTLVLKLEKGDNEVNFVDKEGTNNKIDEIINEVSDIIKSFDTSSK